MDDNAKIIVLVRHGESSKNLRDINGGDGESLTEKGRQQAKDFAKAMCACSVFSNKPFSIYATPAIQAVETADIVLNYLLENHFVATERTPSVCKTLQPVGLGVLSGLSDEEIRINHPIYYDLLRRWRNRELEACELCIPGIESPVVLFERGVEFINSLSGHAVNVVACTRSTFVLLYNILSGKTPEKGGGYKHIGVSNCGYATFSMSDFPFKSEEFSDI